MKLTLRTVWLAAGLSLAAAAPPCQAAGNASNTEYIDPAIGSEGLGRVFVGPAMPFGMIRPSAVGATMPNSGWAPMPEPLRGFAQVHVSGTGGGQKYGNILVMPFAGSVAGRQPLTKPDGSGWNFTRESENISPGYYGCRLREEGIGVEVTAARRAAIYNFSYPAGAEAGLAVDAGFFLGYSPIPDGREAQQLVGSQIEIVSPTEIRGYSRVRGGWNNGRAYTVYFHAQTSEPIVSYATWRGEEVLADAQQVDMGDLTGALLGFAEGVSEVKFKIGISFISELKARRNLLAEIPGWDFDGVRRSTVEAWDAVVNRVTLDKDTPPALKRMFYTGIYHTMLMPSDRTGENPLWNDPTPYYDDFYAIWDTYRTSTPLITLLDPARQADIVNALISIWKRDGFLPDARSGNANGRTQGGSNADVVLADAFAKGLEGIDYELALEAMLTDADVAPAGKGEAEGRGGLAEYNRLGYIPFGIDRAGNRTVEYSLCDYAIAQLAKGLGRDDLHRRFMQQSGNWRNLWRDDYEHAGTRGFIMPRDENGQWLDSLAFGHSRLHHPKYAYTALMWEGPWYTPWWGMFFYEAPSWEYSLSVPHDVPGLIEACGGPEAFERRLDTFFDRGFYNVNNEPSFLSPCLYHWIGKPWRSSQRIREIVRDNFNDGPQGLPGNDDSGAMSSWLAFHILGLYPNAPDDYYLINAPMVRSWSIALANGNHFGVEVENFSPGAVKIESIHLNGEPIADYRITHRQILDGGCLTIRMAPAEEQPQMPETAAAAPKSDAPALARGDGDYLFTFKLHGQTRRYEVKFVESADSLTMLWGIERNLHWQSGSMAMPLEAPATAAGYFLNSSMPTDGEHLRLPANEGAYVLPRSAYEELTRTGRCTLNGDVFELLPTTGEASAVAGKATEEAPEILRARGREEGAEISILADPRLPIVLTMAGNPLEINWTARKL